MEISLLNREFGRLADTDAGSSKSLGAFRDWLLSSDPIQRVRINPYEVAADTDQPVGDIISIALNGVAHGLFDMRWQVHCPHCNMVADEHENFFELTGTSHCQMCDVDFDADFLARVEVTFSLNPGIETLDLPGFCLPPQTLTPKINLAAMPGETVSGSDVIEEPGRYRYFCPVTLAKGILEVKGEETDSEQLFKVRQLDTLDYDQTALTARPGPIRFELVNECSKVCGAYIVRDDLPEELPLGALPQRLTGIEVMHHPDYRRLFGNQVLSDRENLQISSVTLLFTDIAGSTAMYEKLGDVAAYNAVRDHFSVLFEAVEEHGGYVVKTIGDAVMASFVHSGDAIKAASDALHAFQHLNADTGNPIEIRVKFGIHTGPVIVVNLNGRVDYFGSTVNIAARIQGSAKANEIIISDETVARSQPELDVIEADGGASREEKIRFKGIDEEQRITRLSLKE